MFNYDIVLIDTTHDLTDANILTLDLVDHILFMVTNDPLDLKNMRSLISIFKDLNLNNYKVILNESIFPFKNYFGIYDIKNIIKANIDYVLSKDFYIKNMDTIVMNGKIITLDKKASSFFAKDYTTLMGICTDILKRVKNMKTLREAFDVKVKDRSKMFLVIMKYSRIRNCLIN